MRSIAVAAVFLLPLPQTGCGSSANPSVGAVPATDAAVLPVYHEDSVDVKPVTLSRVTPRFPNRLREEYIGGMVWMEFVVDERGRVEESSIEVLCATRDEFVQPAVIARRNYRFNPGLLGSAPVRTKMRDVARFVVTRRGVRQALPICDPDGT